MASSKPLKRNRGEGRRIRRDRQAFVHELVTVSKLPEGKERDERGWDLAVARSRSDITARQLARVVYKVTRPPKWVRKEHRIRKQQR
jgi:hypothetical protein